VRAIEYRLHKAQGRVIQSQAREILYGGAAGAGKSHLLRILALTVCFNVPGAQVYLFRRTYPDLWQNHMTGNMGFPALLAPWIEMGVCAINWGKNQIRFRNGATIHLSHCQHEKDVFGFQGAEIHLLLFDELTHFTASIYRFLRSRVRVTNLDVPARWSHLVPRIVAGSNPGGRGHDWVKAAFISPAPPGEIWRTPDTEGGMDRQFIAARLADNPTLALSDPDYVKRLYGLGSPELVEAMLDGNWDIVSGGALSDLWRRERHVIKPFLIPPSWRISRALDWGSSTPFSVGWWAESDGTEADIPGKGRMTWPRGTFFRIGEWYGAKPNGDGLRLTSSQLADGILEREKKLGIAGRVKPGPADNQIFASTDGPSIHDKMQVRGIRFTESDKSPGSRKIGLELIRERLQATLKLPMEEPGLMIFDRCTAWIDTVPVLSRDESDTDDVAKCASDHAYDETRYMLTAKKPFVGLRTAGTYR
jgi:hypothetical protein